MMPTKFHLKISNFSGVFEFYMQFIKKVNYMYNIGSVSSSVAVRLRYNK